LERATITKNEPKIKTTGSEEKKRVSALIVDLPESMHRQVSKEETKEGLVADGKKPGQKRSFLFGPRVGGGINGRPHPNPPEESRKGGGKI